MFSAKLYGLVTTAILAGCATQAEKGSAVEKTSAKVPDRQCQATSMTERDASQAAADQIKDRAAQQAGVCHSQNGEC
jgi:hypothetical protein